MAAYPITEHEYTLNGGTTVLPCTAEMAVGADKGAIDVGNTAKAAGQVGVRVKAAPGRNASAWLFNATPFTVQSASSIIVMQDDFNDNTLNTSKFALTNLDPTKVLITEFGGQLLFTMKAGQSTASNSNNQVLTVQSINSGAASVRKDRNLSGNEHASSFALVSSVGIAQIMQGAWPDMSHTRMVVQSATNSDVIHTETTSNPDFLIKSKRFKITYNSTTKEVAFWAYVGGWVKMNTGTITYEMGTGLKGRISGRCIGNYNTDLVAAYDDFYLTNSDYTSQYPY